MSMVVLGNDVDILKYPNTPSGLRTKATFKDGGVF